MRFLVPVTVRFLCGERATEETIPGARLGTEKERKEDSTTVESSLRSFSVPSRAPGIGEKNLGIRLDRDTETERERERERVQYSCPGSGFGRVGTVRYWAGDGALLVWTLPFFGGWR